MGDSLRPDWSGRLRRVWRTPPADVSCLVVSTPANIKYLTGFDGSAGLLLSAPDGSWLLVDGRYGSAAHQARTDGRLAGVDIVVAPGSFDSQLALSLERVPGGAVAFEAGHVTVAGLANWTRLNPNRRFEPTRHWVERLRTIKDDAELAVIRRACAKLSGIAGQLSNWVKPGRAETEIARDIESAMRAAGLTRPAFETIVASGPNSALPHARPTSRRLESGDLVVLDFGGYLDGYCGDLTRMAGVGEVKAEARALFEAVRAAQGAALAAVRAQALAYEVDAAARRVLTTHGFGDAFVHGTGHGLGLEVHEAPRLGRRAEGKADRPPAEGAGDGDRLEAGMVCTIEPGAYVEGIGGVRLEDDVVVTEEGCEVLTNAPRDLLFV